LGSGTSRPDDAGTVVPAQQLDGTETNMRTVIAQLILRVAAYLDHSLITVPDIDE
jgi:hypothetical protein